MNPEIVTLDPVISSTLARGILSHDGVNCTLLTLSPGDETPYTDAAHTPEQLLFVVDGQVTVRFGDVNTIVNADHALLLAAGRPYSLAAAPAGTAKVLRVELPPRRVVAPITYPGSS